MYKFEIIAHTNPGQVVAIVGSTPELGAWDVGKAIPLHTNGDRYPMWSTQQAIAFSTNFIEYKYVIKDDQGHVQWENFAPNRQLCVEKGTDTITIDDGAFGYWQPHPFGYLAPSLQKTPSPSNKNGLKILVLGSSVALGYKAWLLKGWAALLGKALATKYGHQLLNVSESGANVERAIALFPTVVTPVKPDLVIIGLSLGNEGLAYCQPTEQKGIQRHFEAGLQKLIKMTTDMGAIPVLGGVYPHNYYSADHYTLLKDTQQRMLTWGVPVLNWLANLDDGQGHWRDDTSFDPAHPNTKGHQLMFEAIDLEIFNLKKGGVSQKVKKWQATRETIIYSNSDGLQVVSNQAKNTLKFINSSPHNYGINPNFQELKDALLKKINLPTGLYLAKDGQFNTLPFFELSPDKTIETYFELPPNSEIEYTSVINWFAPKDAEVLFYDGQVGIFKESEHKIWVINETSHEYNIHPMWKAVRNALKKMTTGVYQDKHFPDVGFRTAIIDEDGLASRIKLPPKAAILFQYQCRLSEISRVGIIPLGARCAARMVLYKLGYDGPAYPFDLTRTTNLSDVADMIGHGFQDMWNRDLLCYNPEEHRIYHRRWSGLSFAHEVEDDEDPLTDMNPVFERMYTRYKARSERFWFTIAQADELLFVRNNYCAEQSRFLDGRSQVIDLLEKLKWKCEVKPFRLLIISPQDSREYAGLEQVIHYNHEFNPDRMYDDQGYWDHCTGVMGHILHELGISSKNLFWCPPNPQWN